MPPDDVDAAPRLGLLASWAAPVAPIWLDDGAHPGWRASVSTPLWPPIISSVSALFGVMIGGFLTARVQKRQWVRAQQIEACAAIVVESTRVQLALRGQWKHDHRVDWVPWNEALARISLVADRAVVDAAGEVDAVFWCHSDSIDRGEVTDEAAWFEATERMETARLIFVNTAKRRVLGSADRLDRLPIRRPRGYMPGVSNIPPGPSDPS
jgi:hypothetical protein